MNPILLDSPSEFTTKRLLLRAPRFGDGKVVNEAIHARDTYVFAKILSK